MTTKELKDILYPKFSEIEAFAFWIAMCIPAIPYLFTPGKLAEAFDLRDLGSYIYYVIGVFIFWTYITVKNLFIKKVMDIEEKRKMAYYFYLIVGFTTMGATLQFFNVPLQETEFDILMILNVVILFFLLFKSLISVAGLKLTKDYKDLLVTQVDDTQISMVQTLLIITVSLATYLLLGEDYTYLTKVMLIYFYADFVVRIFWRKTSLKDGSVI